MTVNDKKIMYEDTFRQQIWDASLKNIKLVNAAKGIGPLISQSFQPASYKPSIKSKTESMKPEKKVSIAESNLSSVRPPPPTQPPPAPPTSPQKAAPKAVSALMSQPFDARNER